MWTPRRAATGGIRRPRRTADVRAAALAGAAALFLLIAAAGCGSDDRGAPTTRNDSGPVDISGTDPVGPLVAGSVAALVTCRDWEGANEDERLATIADIRKQLAPQDSGIKEPELTDDEAAEVFDNACKIESSDGFRLYKLYAQAAGFVTLKRAIEPDDGD
jgi:hypothetical protein